MAIQKFGKYFPYVVYRYYNTNSGWGPLMKSTIDEMHISPFSNGFHYGQAIFEGMKFFFNSKNEAVLLLPELNAERFNISADAMLLPQVETMYFAEAVDAAIIANFASYQPENRYYIRPFMANVSEVLSPGAGEDFLFVVGVTGIHFAEAPIDVFVSQDVARAHSGGVGYAKAAGNYGGVLRYEHGIKQKGYGSILYLDALTNSRIEEAGTMTPVFIHKDGFYLPQKTDTIIESTTAKVLEIIAEEMQRRYVRKSLLMREVISTINNGTLLEAVSLGTASNLVEWQSFTYRDKQYPLPNACQSGNIASQVLARMKELQTGARPEFVRIIALDSVPV